MYSGKNSPLLEDLVRGQRVLVVGHAFLGDALMTTPFIRAIAESGAASLGILAAGAGLDVYGRLPFFPTIYKRGSPSLIRQLRQAAYDLAFVLKDDLASALTVWRCGIKQRRGFAREGASLFLNKAVSPIAAPLHGAARYFSLADVPAPARLKTEYPLQGEERARALALLKESGTPYLVLAPSTTRPEKNWPIEPASRFIQHISQAGHAIVLLGGAADRERHSLINRDGKALDLTGQTTIAEAAALIEGSACIIACDSGPMHLAAALGRPLVALFGQTDPARCGPCSSQALIIRAETGCSPCLRRHCGKSARCMASISAEQVYEACLQLAAL